ncbi:MAG: hypothetical protein PVG39_00080 [Desulfobacteraceae bacterium]|jgi:hypothetical protein
MNNVIDLTTRTEVKWTLSNGWNIYIWNRMLQDQVNAEEENKLLSTAKKPLLDPADIGMEIDPDNLNNFPEELFDSTPLGDNYFYDNYIQRLNQREESTFTWPTPKEVRVSDRDFPADYSANITMADIPSLVGDGKKIGCPQHNSKESSQQENSCRIQDTTGREE